MRYVWALLISIAAVWFIGTLFEYALERTFVHMEQVREASRD